MGRIKNDTTTMNTLKSYTMDTIKNTGIKGSEVGNFQGIFRYKKEQGYVDIIAMKGTLYTIDNANTYSKLLIQGLPSFQTNRPIEGVQYRDKLYIATGSGLVVYDGTTASLVTAYTPNGLEALYIGTNGYAADPDNYLSDTTGSSDTILGVTVNQRYGIVNQSVTFTAYMQKISTDVLEYRFESMKPTDADYTIGSDWGTSKVFNAVFTVISDYSIRISVRVQGTTTILSQYILPKYTVKAVYDVKPEPSVNFSNMSTCNRVLVHYDRLMLYGDLVYPDQLYISHSNNFSYFPRTNIMNVVDPLRGTLQNVTRFKDFLVCFTDGSIQQITGTGTDPTNYTLKPVHTSLGTTRPFSVQVMQNYVAFVGNDNGVYILKTFNYAATNDKMNVQRIDEVIKDLIVGHIAESTRVLSCVYNNQYYLYVQTATDNFMYRYYYEMDIWVRDRIDIQFKTLTILDTVLTASSAYTGIIYNLKKGVFFDGTNTVFEMTIQSKDYDMNMPHHRKKMKQFQLLADMTGFTVVSVDVYGDNTLLTTQEVTHDPEQESDAEKLKVTTSGRFRYTKVNLRIPVKEDIQLLGYAFIFKLNTPK
jgi:hypothetical protein